MSVFENTGRRGYYIYIKRRLLGTVWRKEHAVKLYDSDTFKTDISDSKKKVHIGGGSHLRNFHIK